MQKVIADMENLLNTLVFDDFVLNNRKETITAIDKTKKYIIKIQVKNNPKKQKNIQEEYETLLFLNKRGCVSCPTVYEYGKIESGLLQKLVDIEKTELEYIIQEYCASDTGYNLADVFLSMIEQKKLGIYQGDIKPENVRFNSQTGVCTLIDYDQSISLTDEQAQMSNLDFLKFCDLHDKKFFGFGNWLRHFGKSNKDLEEYFENGSLNLSSTTVFSLQKTTNSKSGIYHTINSRDVIAHGSRGLDRRAEILDTTAFEKGESVLDVGCNAGLLCEYLYQRGCSVTGVDNDPHIVIAAKVIANITNKNINYSCMDLDFVEKLDFFDTIMLFSVFHHTRDPIKNAKKISSSCKRILIETRLSESGKQPIDGSWVDTTKWSFDNLNDLVFFLESIFEGFKLKRNLGFADKGRYVLELIKQ